MQRLSPAARDIRLGAEHALEALYRNRSKARVNSDTLGDMEVAAWRFDTLGMKIQFTQEINPVYGRDQPLLLGRLSESERRRPSGE